MGVAVGGEDSDSSVTMVEGSVTESDVEEEFCWRRWLPFLSEEMTLNTEIINEGAASPEICFIQKFSDHTYNQKEEQINPTPQEAYASDQCQSMLQGCLALTENTSEPDFSLHASGEGLQNNSAGQEAFSRNSVNPVCHISLSVINRRNIYGETLLHKAVVHQDVNLVRNIIKAGGNVNVQDYSGWTALHKASVEGFYGIANELLKAGADVNARGNEQITPLQEAVEEGHYKVAELLLWYGADPLLKNKMGRCALEEASDSSMRKLLKSYVEKFRRHSVSVGDDSMNMLNTQSAEDTNLQQIVENMQKETSQKTDEEVFAEVSGTEGTGKNEEGNAETDVLSQFTETEDVQTKRVRLDPQETSQKAASYSSSSKIKLSSNQSQFNQASEQQASEKSGWTAIHEASNRGFTEVVLELLKAGANVNSRSLDGILPIHDAVSGNYLEAVRTLLQHGANPCERDGSGKSALDGACDDEMKELLNSYSAMDSVLPVETTEVTNVYIPRLSQVEDTLNEMLAKEKTERATLAKKYRASVESSKKRASRKQLVNLASRQKGLLTVSQTQEKLVQKIKNYRKTKQVSDALCSEKQSSNLVISHGNDKRQSSTADEIMCLDVVTFGMGLGASMPIGNRVEPHLSSENRFSAQECSQHPHICFDEKGANKEAIRSKEASDHALASENSVREYPFNNMSKLTNAVEVVTFSSEPTVSTAKTKRSQQKDIDCVVIAEQGNKSLYPTSVTSALNVVEPQSAVVNNNVCQPGSDCQQGLTDEDLHRYVNKKEAFKQRQQQQVILSISTKKFPNTLQQMIFPSSKNSLNTNLVLTDHTSNTDYPVNLSEESSQSYSNQECEQKQVRYRRKNSKNLQLIDLLELGRIKPGENVLEFKLQEFSYKATLLNSGKIRTSKRQILCNPIQWVKDLLGNDISVTRKYVWNKVTYLGTQLSKFLFEEASVSSDLELPSQERETTSGSSVQFNSVESLTHFLRFHEKVMVCKKEFLPCHLMEKHWNFYKGCEDFGF